MLTVDNQTRDHVAYVTQVVYKYSHVLPVQCLDCEHDGHETDTIREYFLTIATLNHYDIQAIVWRHLFESVK